MNIRKALPEDVEDIMKLEAECMKHPWSRADIEALTVNELKAALIACEGDVPSGYIGFSFVADEAEIGNLCVSEGFRRCGIATELLRETFAYLADRGIKTVFLEVAGTNGGAIALYEKNGFEHYHSRAGYYGDDDALLYRRYL